MSEEFDYNVLTFHLPSGEKFLVAELGDAYNNGWKPTGLPVLIDIVIPSKNGGNKETLIIYTLAREKVHHHSA